MARRKHAVHEEEHENHERWLITYADMITLLMVLFIVLFAMSTVEEKKFNALKEGLAAGFGQSTSILDGSESILDQPGTSAVTSIRPSKVKDTPEIAQLKSQAVADAAALRERQRYDDAAAEADRLLRIRDRLLAVLADQGLDSDVRTTIDGRGLTVSLVSKHVVFDLNLATLTPRGRRILDAIAPVLRSLDDKLSIEGHTNQAPGRPKYYPSDWDLSTARAVTVLRYLQERRGVPSARLSAVGFGKIKPLVDPDTAGSQQINKRVDIVVLSALVEENKELLTRVGLERTQDTAAGGRES